MRIPTKIVLQIWLLIISSLRLMADPLDAASVPRAAVADFNGDGHPDYVIRNVSDLSSRPTAIWYLNNNVFIGSANGPTLPVVGWDLRGVADFNRDGHPDYALF